jgi:Ser/Thr protein kinase RdoA (MazF antagonist)
VYPGAGTPTSAPISGRRRMPDAEARTTAPDGLVHGMGRELVEADWPALTDAEVAAVLPRFVLPEHASAKPTVVWRSPRPMSAAAIVTAGHDSVFVKRSHVAVRSAAQLGVEHAFADWLRSRRQPVPAVLRTRSGDTVVRAGDFVYEVHETANGVDLYRDAISWSPFTSLGHCRSAGYALARFHRAATHFALPPRQPSVLMSSISVIAATDPEAELGRLLLARPGLARAAAGRPLATDFTRHLLPAIRRASPLLALLPPQWGHGDWHGSNLTWSSTSRRAAVTGVLDLGLANRTFAVHDLAIALERSTIDWLELAKAGSVEADLAAVDAFIDGYEGCRQLDELERAALVEVLPIAHLEYALSELEYFEEIVASDAAADLAYNGYLVGHARWFEGSAGSELLEHLRHRFGLA